MPMEEDLISSLTRQVKEEVIENYLTERRLIELQTEEIRERSREVRNLAADVGKRITRMGLLCMSAGMRHKLAHMLAMPEPSFWAAFLEEKFSHEVRFIRVIAITGKARYRKLFLEGCRRLYQWMEKYQAACDELKAELQAVNVNITAFHRNFDLLTLLSFVKSLDVAGLEQKHFLGENFTPEELASVDQKLHIPLLSFDKMEIPTPLRLPRLDLIGAALNELASEIYEKHATLASKLVK